MMFFQPWNNHLCLVFVVVAAAVVVVVDDQAWKDSISLCPRVLGSVTYYN